MGRRLTGSREQVPGFRAPAVPSHAGSVPQRTGRHHPGTSCRWHGSSASRYRRHTH